MIGLGAYILAFMIQRTLIYDSICVYYPDLINLFRSKPYARPTHMQSFMFCFPFWCAINFFFLQVVKHRQTETERQNKLTDLSTQRDNAGNGAPLSFPTSHGVDTIDVESISHITVEDHYCRFFLVTPGGLKEKLIKSALNQVIPKIPLYRNPEWQRP